MKDNPLNGFCPLQVLNFSLPFFCIIVLFFGCSGSLPENVYQEYEALPETIDYNYHIKPILSDRCYACHGPDVATRKAGLRLDLEEEAFKKLQSGNFAFVRGHGLKSEVIQRLISGDPEKVMPPPDSELEISDREIALIAKWLDQGAEWKEHWAFIPLEAITPPSITEDWKQFNPIDNFIQDRLKSTNLNPSPQAEKEYLIKRVTMDLTGLPPTIEEIDSFLNDSSPNAFENVVDRLLQSDACAERLAQEWLDVARYSDSHGVSFDGYRTSWPYRDWLINAFKQNMPYDKFITQQLAGDLIEDPNEETIKATAFLRLNPLEASGGSIDEEFRLEYVNERASMVGTALLGLTVECAKCHDHKFDPIQQKEFYQLSAFFNNTQEYGLAPVDADRPPSLILLDDKQKGEINEYLKTLDKEEQRISDIKNTGSFEFDKELPISSPTDYVAYYPFDKIEFYKKEIKRRPPPDDEDDKKKKEKKEPKKKIFQEIQILDGNKKEEANLKITLEEGKYGKSLFFNEEYDVVSLRKVGEFDHMDSFSVSAWISTNQDSIGSTQTIIGNSGNIFQYHRGWDMVLDSTNHLRVRMIHRLPDEFISVTSQDEISPNDWNHVGFTYDGSKSSKGISLFLNGKKLSTVTNYDKLKRSILPINDEMKRDTIPLLVGKSFRLWTGDLGMFSGKIDEIKIYKRQLSQWEMGLLGEASLDAKSADLLKDHWFIFNQQLAADREKLREVRTKLTRVLDSANELMVMKELDKPRKTYVLDKGIYNQPLEEVKPGGISKVLPYNEELPQNRLGLSKWLLDKKNPVVPRVAINRYWQMIFGKGLVKTSEDFGSQGDRPTHPELLDWLAKDFMEHDWDIKYALKQMVMSYTYQQSSKTSNLDREIDPENKLLARSPSYRWSAEMIRDNALKASGLLVEKIGGPSVKPYQPEGLWKEVIQASGVLKKYKQDTGDNLYRRSLYTFSRRFAPNPFMINFD
ncbi:DUF1549 domain-containing protein, partial [Aegicerativicinus sediminis]